MLGQSSALVDIIAYVQDILRPGEKFQPYWIAFVFGMPRRIEDLDLSDQPEVSGPDIVSQQSPTPHSCSSPSSWH